MNPLSITLLSFVLIVQTLGAKPYSIPSGSMLPTLPVGDYLLAAKSPYIHNQTAFFLGGTLPGLESIATGPARGDIILFRLPSQPDVTYIQRVIGLAGDRVQLKAGIVYLNGKALDRARIGGYELPEDYAQKEAVEYRETLPGGKSYRIIDMSEGEMLDDTREFLVPAGSCFVLGDNRDNAVDSRHSVGFVPYANILARALVTVDSSGGALRAHAPE